MVTSFWIRLVAVGAARRNGNTTALIVLGFVGGNLLQEQITGHGTINGFVWIFVGVCLAAARIGLEERFGLFAGNNAATHSGTRMSIDL